MVELGCCRRLGPESPDRARRDDPLSQDRLSCDDAVQAEVAGPVIVPKPPRPSMPSNS